MALDQYGRPESVGSFVNPLEQFGSLSQMFAGIGRGAIPQAPVANGFNTSALPGVTDQERPMKQGPGAPSTAMAGTTRVINSQAPTWQETPYTGVYTGVMPDMGFTDPVPSSK
jgi:hypothetical protein